MSACNGFAVAVSERRTFFTDIAIKYPEVSPDGKLNTADFLQASKSFMKFFDYFGRCMAAMKYDVNGNIEKLEKKFNTNPDRFKMLNDMIQYEMEEEHSRFAIDSLLWLRRALEFSFIFFKCVIDDHQSGAKTENLVPFCLHAYERSLKPYHGWALRKVCSLAMHVVPWRRDLMRCFAHGRDGMDDVVVIDMEEFMETVSSNLKVICKMYDEWSLNSDAVV